MPKQAHTPHGSDYSGSAKSREQNYKDAEKLDREAEEVEKLSKSFRDAADKNAAEQGDPLGEMLNPSMAGYNSRQRVENDASADRVEERAKKLRNDAQALRDKPIESVVGDLDRDLHSTKPTTDAGAAGASRYELFSDKFTVGAVVVGLVLVGGLYVASGNKQMTIDDVPDISSEMAWTTGPNGEAVQISIDDVANFSDTNPSTVASMTIDDVANFPLQPDGSVENDGKKYYVVTSEDKAKDTGNEVCALVGKSCVGYTDLSLGSCLANHPGAQQSKDMNGSSAGFYCNGSPQGGVCAKEPNTCHICPNCNVNMDCAMEIGVLYRETYVECK